jgi:hypothetical protein
MVTNTSSLPYSFTYTFTIPYTLPKQMPFKLRFGGRDLRFVILASLLALVLSAAPCSAAEPARFELTETFLKARSETLWFGLYYKKKKMGFVRWQFLSRDRKGSRAWVLLIETHMKLAAFGQKTETKESEEWIFEGRPPHKLIKASRTHQSGGKTLNTSTIECSGGAYAALITEGGQKRKMDLGPLDSTLADVFAADVWVGKKPPKGERISYRAFPLTTLQQQVESAELLERKTVVMGGVETTVSTLRLIPSKSGPTYTIRVDPLGRWLSASYPGEVESRLESEEMARKTDFCHDIYTQGAVRVDKPLGIHPKDIKRLVLAVPAKSASAIPPGPRQLVREEGEETRLSLGAGAGKEILATRTDYREFLKESLKYPIHHEKVRKLAAEAVGKAGTDREKVDRLVAFVFRFLKKEYKFEPHSIFEIIEHRRGDCSEHSHLFAVLARCAGLPARVVDGLVYMGDGNSSFGIHAWNEVVIDGKWVPVDPTWGQTEVDATHILLKREGRALGWESLGDVTFRVIRVEKK